MPKLIKTVPKYRKHKASGQAVVALSGRDCYLGPYGTKASKAEYDRLVMQWLAEGRSPVSANADLTVNELLARYWKFADKHYRKNGKPTGEISNICHAVRPLKRLYGRRLSRDFGPLALKAIQRHMIVGGLSRGVINARINRIRRVFRWAVSEQLVPLHLCHGLSAVSGLQRDRTEARETEPVRPVPAEVFERTLGFLPPIVRDMVQLQRVTGMRPGELRILRPMDVDRAEKVWAYRPESHKTEHYGRERMVFIGPKGQDILGKYLLRDASSFCFSPAETMQYRHERMHARRKTPASCGNSVGTNRKDRPRRKPRDHYDAASYRRAVHRACDLAGVTRWAPSQLRHAMATEVRKRFGLEAAQCTLGHAKANVTELYAERDTDLAKRIISEVG